MQPEFRIKRVLARLEMQDVSTSEDGLTAFLERRGWTEKLIKTTQDSISRKLTIDMFGKIEELSAVEITLQTDIDRYRQIYKKRTK
jgi:hypothetical protein